MMDKMGMAMFSTMMRLVSCAALCLVIAAGCGGSSKDTQKLVPVSGTLKIDGELVSNAIVQFLPEGTTQGDSFYGTTNERGEYKLVSRTGRDGCGIGMYKVIFSKMAMKDGSPIPKDMDAITAGATEQIPAKFNNPDKSQVIQEVPEGGKTIDFDLKSK